MDSGETYEDQRLIWVDQQRVDYEAKVRDLDNGPSGLASYRFAWNGNQLHQADAAVVVSTQIADKQRSG